MGRICLYLSRIDAFASVNCCKLAIQHVQPRHREPRYVQFFHYERSLFSPPGPSFAAVGIVAPISNCIIFLSCSKKTKVNIVCGLGEAAALAGVWNLCRTALGPTHVSRSQAGSQPLKRNRGPSVRRLFSTIVLIVVPEADALWILLLSTSAGAHIVVATVPAVKDASVCVAMPSFCPSVPIMCLFAIEYLFPPWLV